MHLSALLRKPTRIVSAWPLQVFFHGPWPLYVSFNQKIEIVANSRDCTYITTIQSSMSRRDVWRHWCSYTDVSNTGKEEKDYLLLCTKPIFCFLPHKNIAARHS